MGRELKLYTASADDDIRVAHWYLRMATDGDLARLFTADSRTLASLYRTIGRPNTLVYAEDAAGLWLAMWASPVLAGAFLGLWVRSDHRRRRAAFGVVLDAYAWMFQTVSVVFGVTKQPNILAGHRKLGYAVIDALPAFFDGEDAWLVRLTRERFAETLTRYRRPGAVGVPTAPVEA